MAWRNFQAKIWKKSKNVTCKISPYRRSRTGLKISLDLRLSSTSLKTGEFMLLLLWVNLRLLIFKKDSFGLVPTAIRKFLSISCRIEVLSFYNKMIMTMQVCRLKEAWTIFLPSVELINSGLLAHHSLSVQKGLQGHHLTVATDIWDHLVLLYFLHPPLDGDSYHQSFLEERDQGTEEGFVDFQN